MKPQFSVIIPCYKQAHWLGGAIESALQQDASEVEIIVVDDGSPDNTAEVAAQYPDVKLIRQANAGLSAARNAGILASSGNYLVFLDADDMLKPDFFRVARAALAVEPAIDVLHGYADVVDVTCKNILTRFGGVDIGDDPYHKLLLTNIGPPNTFVIRRDIIAKVGFFDTRLRSVEDWHMWLRIAATGAKFMLAPTLGAIYRDSPGSMSKNVEVMWVNTRMIISNARQLHECEKCFDILRHSMLRFAGGLRPGVRDLCLTASGRRQLRGIFIRNPDFFACQLRLIVTLGPGLKALAQHRNNNAG